jgi:hypothetical protein
MPNDCCNHITITCENPHVRDELTSLVENELQNENVRMIKQGRRGIIFDVWSPWNPDYEWLEGLVDKYPNCWIKNEWYEEGGLAGVWIGFINNRNEKTIQDFTWDDICIEGKVYLFMNEEEERKDEEERKMLLNRHPPQNKIPNNEI